MARFAITAVVVEVAGDLGARPPVSPRSAWALHQPGIAVGPDRPAERPAELTEHLRGDRASRSRRMPPWSWNAAKWLARFPYPSDFYERLQEREPPPGKQ